MSKREVGILKRLLVRKFFRRGDAIIRAGDKPSEMYILASGTPSVSVSMEGAARKRIATFSPGMMFGDMAVLEQLPRSADVTADSEMEVLALSAEQFDSLTSLHPRLQMLLLQNLSLALARRVREANIGLLIF